MIVNDNYGLKWVDITKNVSRNLYKVFAPAIAPVQTCTLFITIDTKFVHLYKSAKLSLVLGRIVLSAELNIRFWENLFYIFKKIR